MTNRIRSLAAAAALLVPGIVSAQAAAKSFGMGSRIVSVGILTGGDYDGLGIGGAFEVGVYEFTPSVSLGVGAFGGFVKGDANLTNGFKYDITQVPIMAIGNVHLAVPSQPKLDLYGGMSFGIVSTRFSYEGAAPNGFDGDTDSDIGIGLQVGARYAFTPRVTAFGQLGANDIPLLFAGLTFKF